MLSCLWVFCNSSFSRKGDTGRGGWLPSAGRSLCRQASRGLFNFQRSLSVLLLNLYVTLLYFPLGHWALFSGGPFSLLPSGGSRKCQVRFPWPPWLRISAWLIGCILMFLSLKYLNAPGWDFLLLLFFKVGLLFGVSSACSSHPGRSLSASLPGGETFPPASWLAPLRGHPYRFPSVSRGYSVVKVQAGAWLPFSECAWTFPPVLSGINVQAHSGPAAGRPALFVTARAFFAGPIRDGPWNGSLCLSVSYALLFSISRLCLKIAFRRPRLPLCGRFGPDGRGAADRAHRLRPQYTAKRGRGWRE